MKKIFLILSVCISGNSFCQCTNCDGNANTGINSSSIGTNTVSSGNSSFASGFASEAIEDYSTAFGFYSKANGVKAVAIGSMVKAIYDRSIVIGSGGGYGSEHFLTSPNERSLTIGFSSIYPTLFVSDSPLSPYDNKTGRIGIGNITNPLAKIHVKSDEDESASLYLEPSNWTSDYNAEIFLGNMLNGISANLGQGLMFKTEHNYMFNQGNIGIGTEEPASKVHIKSGDIYIEDIDRGIIMKSPDGTCWRGTINNQGQLTFEILDECPENTTVSIKEPTSNKLDIRIHPNPAENIIEIEIPEIDSQSIALMIVDENGKVVKSIKLTSTKTTVNISDLAPGLYFGNFTGEQVYFVEKFIKL